MRARFILLSTASYLAVASAAHAADMVLKAPPPPPVVASWTGFYIGIHGGVAGLNAKVIDTPGGFECDPTEPCRVSDTSGVLGGQAGYNWQIQNWVIGAEGDGSWLNARATHLVGPTTFAFSRIDWLASARGRVGFLVADGAGLIYGTAGVAWAGFKGGWADEGYSNFLDKTLTGVVAGGGVEAMVSRNWTFRAEALWYGFDKKSVTSTQFGFTHTTEFKDNNVLVGRLGLNLKW